MRPSIWIIIAVNSLVATFARAGEPLDLLRGYDKARWGQTSDEVQKLYGTKIQGGVVYLSGSGADQSLPAEVDVFDLKLPEPEPLVDSVVFRFLENRLCAVEVTLTAKAREATNNETLAKVIWEKYYTDPDVRAKFAQAHLLVWLRAKGRNPEPHAPADLLPPESSVSSVWYENQELWNQQVSKAKERKQRETERAKQAVTETNLKKVL